jgi:membrane associated rhomboid family serine protease
MQQSPFDLLQVTYLFLGLSLLMSFTAWSKPALFQRWIFHPYSIQRHGQYERFLSSGFIHADYAHLFFNMFTLYFFGSLVEKSFGYFFPDLGWLIFAGLYLLGIVAAVLPTFFKHRYQAYYRSLGASGGVAAVVFSGVMFNPTGSIYLMLIPIPIPAFLFAGLYLFYSAYQARQNNDQINHDAHLFGALFGILYTVAFVPDLALAFVDRVLAFRLDWF